MLSPNAFSDPWQHVRLLSDAARNRAMIDTVVRHSPGRRVLEAGCGTGLLSCIAARAGATKVFAVEPTDMLYVAREVVRRNGLEGVVEVIPGMVEDVPLHPVDFAFSELLHSDPLTEGVVDAANAMAKWLVPGGILAPRTLTVWAALVEAPGPVWEVRAAEEEIRVHANRFGLDLAPVSEVLRSRGRHVYSTGNERPVGPPVEVFRIKLGDGAPIPGPVERVLEVEEGGTVAGAMVWFEADMDDVTVLGNPPLHGGHWGQLVWAFGDVYQSARGDKFTVRFEAERSGLAVTLVA